MPWTLPPVAPAPWSLTLTGLQNETLTLSLKDLDMFPQKSLSRRWISHSGWTVRCEWQGVLLQHLIEKLRPPTGRTLYIQQHNAQGFTESIALKEILLHRPMVVRAVNGQPLPAMYGGPLSLMLFHCYSYKGLNQLTGLTLTEEPVNQWSQSLGVSASGTLVPGSYFAWDLGLPQTLKRATEIEDY
jgi:DMSO/TMAO reductase YedYZ molybdopterin-dependent catalytic subunit